MSLAGCLSVSIPRLKYKFSKVSRSTSDAATLEIPNRGTSVECYSAAYRILCTDFPRQIASKPGLGISFRLLARSVSHTANLFQTTRKQQH